jgi:hypothetical protein
MRTRRKRRNEAWISSSYPWKPVVFDLRFC